MNNLLNELLENGRLIEADNVECPHCVELYALGPFVAGANPPGLLAVSRLDDADICSNCASAEALAASMIGVGNLLARLMFEVAALGDALKGGDGTNVTERAWRIWADSPIE